MTERNSSLHESTEWSIPAPSGFSQMPGQPLESRNLNTIFLSLSDRLSEQPVNPIVAMVSCRKNSNHFFYFLLSSIIQTKHMDATARYVINWWPQIFGPHWWMRTEEVEMYECGISLNTLNVWGSWYVHHGM